MIGVYDSGIGGLSVLKELIKLMPGEDYIYFSDSAYCPYGQKDPEFIRERATEITKKLIAECVEIIVVACNTATAAAIDMLRKNFDIPFIGMEPAIKPAVLESKSGVVGVIATEGTLKGSLYHNTLDKFSGSVKVIEKVGEGLVETVEKGVLDGKEVEVMIHKCVDPMLSEGVDHIVLGCTHYPFLQPVIERIVGKDVTVINPAPAVARQTRKVLLDRHNWRPAGIGRRDYISSGDVSVLLQFCKKLSI